jgi:hypothetical protein
MGFSSLMSGGGRGAGGGGGVGAPFGMGALNLPFGLNNLRGPGGPGVGPTPVAGGDGGAGGDSMRRGFAGALGGFGQGMMDQNMRRTYGTARSGGYYDLMENRNIGDFVRTGGRVKAHEALRGGRSTRELVESLLGSTATNPGR